MESPAPTSASFPSKQVNPKDAADSSHPAADELRVKRQSLRLRPSQHLENAEPPSPLRDTSLPSISTTKSPKMSLFSLFSRPKVEKLRGYTERGLEVPPPPPAKDLRKTASTPNLVAHIQQANEPPAPRPPPSPAATAPVKSKSRLKFSEPTKPTVRDIRTGPFEPPPLFQAYPQSIKDGSLEVSVLSVEAATHKSKGRKVETTDENASINTRHTRSALKHVANGGNGHVELPQKIFVLITSGYLLQYAESGPANRLPEKILHLGSDSAAFASDLIPGRHHVLQVSQAVNQEGGLLAHSTSIFSKLGIRSAATRRMTSSFLLVMPSATEMESWMTAIRREIAALGGKQCNLDAIAATDSDSAGTTSELQKTPSHRYQVKRNPSKVERLTSPTQTSASVPAKPVDGVDSDSDAATIEGIELEASKLDEDGKEAVNRERALSDVPSMSSSASPSVAQSQLNNIRSSESNSVRTSNTSQAGTFSSPAATSQTSSVAGSPPAERPLNEGAAKTIEHTSPKKASVRSLASYSMSWRRSGVPLALQKPGALQPILNISPSRPNFDIIEESPVVGKIPPTTITGSPNKTLTAARSEPNLRTGPQASSKRDSKTPSPPPVPSVPATVTPYSQQPKTTTECPPADPAQTSTPVASRRTSIQSISTQHSAANPVRSVDTSKGKRISFSMPLKVNPSGVHAQPSVVSNSRRTSQIYDPDAPGDTPTVHVLSAKVDAPKRTSYSQRISASPSATLPNTPSPNSRYSLLPGTVNTSPAMPTRPAPSPTNISMFAGTMQAQAYTAPLRRPASLQVRSDMAPFLSSVRNSQTGQIDARAIPIRGMKPSRSASNVAALAAHHENTKNFRATTPTVPEEADQAMPLPERAMSPLPPRAGSRTSMRRGAKTRSYMPELDFGIPVVGLGPPAPPPSAPLPLPPPASRPTSPSPAAGHATSTSGIEAVAGLGIRVS